MRKNITIRLSKRSEPLFEEIEKIVKAQAAGNDKYTPVLLNLIELGLKSYQSGNRLECGEVINVKQNSFGNVYHEPSIENEVAQTLYPTLSGIISSLRRNEARKEQPNEDFILLYTEIKAILSEDHRNFYQFSDDEIQKKVAILSPIIKEMVTSDKSMHHQILVNNMDNIKKLVSTNNFKIIENIKAIEKVA